jgi:hypothetical protein
MPHFAGQDVFDPNAFAVETLVLIRALNDNGAIELQASVKAP